MTDEPEVPAAVRAAFTAGPGEEPALRIGPEDLLAGGHRALRRRRLLGAGAGGVAVTAVILAVSAIGPGIGGTVMTGGSAGPPTDTRTSAPAGPRTVPPTPWESATPSAPVASPTYTPGTLTALGALTGVLRRAVPLPPGARLVGGATADAGPLQFVVGPGGLEAAADLVDPLGRGHLQVRLVPLPARAGGPCTGHLSCASRVTAAGDQVVTAVERDGEMETNVVSVTRPDGTGLVVASGNYEVTAARATPRRATRPTPPWTTDQLVAIALDPGLRTG